MGESFLRGGGEDLGGEFAKGWAEEGGFYAEDFFHCGVGLVEFGGEGGLAEEWEVFVMEGVGGDLVAGEGVTEGCDVGLVVDAPSRVG